MKLNDFEDWLVRHPDEVRRIVEPPLNLDSFSLSGIRLPLIYEEFLIRFGPMAIFDRHLMLLGKMRILEASAFVRGLNHLEENICFDGLAPFCDTGSDGCHYCFDEGRVIHFDPLNTISLEDTFAPSFEDFLDIVMARYGRKRKAT